MGSQIEPMGIYGALLGTHWPLRKPGEALGDPWDPQLNPREGLWGPMGPPLDPWGIVGCLRYFGDPWGRLGKRGRGEKKHTHTKL